MSAWDKGHPSYRAAVNTTNLGRLRRIDAVTSQAAYDAAVMASRRLVLEILLLVKRLFAGAEKKLLAAVTTGKLLVMEFERHKQFIKSCRHKHD